MKEAKYYIKLENNNVKCLLCPRLCIIKNREYGECKARKNIDGKLYSMTYGSISSLAIDPMEKKPLFHFYPNEPILSIGSFGCNMHCLHCQNWEISQHSPEDFIITKKYSPKEIIEIALRKNIDHIAFTYNEPLINYEYYLEIAKLAKEHKLNVVFVTNGMINEKPFKELLEYTDALNIDLKGDKEFYEKYCFGDFDTVIKNIKIAKKMEKWIEITWLVIENLNDNKRFITFLRDFISNIDENIPLHISKYFPMYKLNYPPTTEKRLLELKSFFEEKLNYVYIGNTRLENVENTYCPVCKSLMIERKGFHARIIKLKCHVELPGKFRKYFKIHE